jgi:pilus assembly protein TadC
MRKEIQKKQDINVKEEIKKKYDIDVQEEKENDKKGRFKIPKIKNTFFLLLIVSLILGAAVYLFTRSFTKGGLTFGAIFVLFGGYLLIRVRLQKAAELKKMEDVFPDFISLMASNLRAGMTIDRALLLSSRKEFAPLDKQIVLLAKDIVTGKEISQALDDTAKRIKSEKITKTIRLIVSGIKSGGNLAVLLEETAQNLRERDFIEKRAASNVLMYVIFIFFASAIGAPMLFALSSVLVEIMTNLVGSLPQSGAASNIPFALTSVSISTSFVVYFSLVFVVVSNILASLVLGLVSKGKEREGFKYLLPMILLALGIFLGARIFLLQYFSNLTFG